MMVERKGSERSYESISRERHSCTRKKKKIYKSASAKNLNILAGHPQKATCFEHHQFGV